MTTTSDVKFPAVCHRVGPCRYDLQIVAASNWNRAPSMPWVEVFAVLLVCHSVGDYPLQSLGRVREEHETSRGSPR